MLKKFFHNRIIYSDSENMKQSLGKAFPEDLSETVEDFTERAIETLKTSLFDNVTQA